MTASIPAAPISPKAAISAVVGEIGSIVGDGEALEVVSIFSAAPAPKLSDAVMGGRSKVLSARQLKDADIAVKRITDGKGTWPFPGSWYFPPSAPKLSNLSLRDPNRYFSIPVLLIMPVDEFSSRFQSCPCARFGYEHRSIVSHGYTVPCRVVGPHFTYALVGNRYSCLDCKVLNTGSYTFCSYDERFLAQLPPDIRYRFLNI